MPRDSATAQTTLCASTRAIVDAPVLERAVDGLPVPLRVPGREVVVVLYAYPYEDEADALKDVEGLER